MHKTYFSKESLCVFFIVMCLILGIKGIIDVKDYVLRKIGTSGERIELVDYNAYSYRTSNEKIDLDKITIVNNFDELKAMKNKVSGKNNLKKWITKKLNNYNEEFFTKKELVVLCINDYQDSTTHRISGVQKKSDNSIVININRTVLNNNKNTDSTWIAIVEMDKVNENISVNVMSD